MTKPDWAFDSAPAADYEYYATVAESVGKNVSFTAIGLGIIWLASRVWMLPAKILFWAELILHALNTLHIAFITAIGVIAFVAGKRESKWLWGANAARLLEVLLCGLIMYFAARIVGYL